MLFFCVMSSEFIKKQKKLYEEITPCYCKAIGEVISFNADGLNHLLYDKYRPRSHNEKHYRMGLVDYIYEAVTKAEKAVKQSFTNPDSNLWILDWVEVNGNDGRVHVIKVILRKEGNGKVHFWSVMQKKSFVGREIDTKKPKHGA